MQVFKSAGMSRSLLLCAGVGAIALGAGAAAAQAAYPDYPPPPPSYRDYPPAPNYRDYPPPPPEEYRQAPRYSDPRYADPAYESYQAYRAYNDRAERPAPRYADPRDEDARGEQARDEEGYQPRAYPARRQTRRAAPPEQPSARFSAPAPTVSEGQQASNLPPATLPHRLVESANAYAAYMKNAGSISPGFKSGASVAEAVKTGAGYEAHQLQEGAIAYAAMTALQEPAFVAGARQLLREGDNGASFAAELAGQPEAVLNIAGADLAGARAASALHKHGVHLVSSGAEVKQAAYDVQHSAWSKSQVTDPDARLAAAKVASAKRFELKAEQAPELTKAVLSETQGDGEGARSPLVTRSLAVAALAAIGQLHDDDANVQALLSEPRSADCLKMAKLNLFQCLSVSRPHYEDIFCLGQHAMMDTGQCMVKAAGYTPAPTTVARAGAK